MINSSMRLVVVAQEFPYPPNHGGRADVWRRVNALKQLGCQVGLVCWVEDSATAYPSEADFEVVRDVVDFLEVIPQKRGVLALLLRLARVLAGVPSHAASRVVSGRALSDLVESLKGFAPDAVLLDCPYGGVFAMQAASALNVPLFYRSHNIEHRYFSGQAAAATCFRNKLAWYFACLHLKSFEKKVIEQAVLFFDISIDDLEFWGKQGMHHGFWLPPLPEEALKTGVSDGDDSVMLAEVGFLGNLNAPNNVKGVAWLVNEVMPVVWRLRPRTVLTIAGSRPSDEVLQLVAQDERIRLIKNVPNAPQFLASTGVLVNPVLSGSGVNVKTLDMLMTDRPIVSSPQGVAGLNQEIKQLCEVADTPEKFARSIVMQLENPAVDMAARIAARRFFSVQAVQTMLSHMRSAMQANQLYSSISNDIESKGLA